MPGLHMSAYALPGSMAWSAPQYPAAMSIQSMLSPGLKFFIERDDGSLVPLLPVDELPDDIRLAGVPLSLNASQANGMVFLGHDSSVGKKFSHAEFLSTNEPAAPVPVAMKYTPGVVPQNNRIPQSIQMQPAQSQPLPAPTPAFISTPTPPDPIRPKSLYNERPPPPSGIEPDQRKKIYCNYWCQTGQCGFIQQGCIYKHEMPEDKETLNLIGLKSVPAWWRKEQARKKSKVKRNERNGSSSEWEVVERQQTDTSALHSDDPVRVRVPPRPAGIPVAKQPAQKPRPALFAQKELTTSDVPSDTATAGSSAPGSASPPGGVKLGAPKTPVRGPPYLPFRKQTLESPIEDEAEEDLIDFNVLVPSSSPDLSSPSQSSPEARVNNQPKAVMESRHSKIVTKGDVAVSTGRGARSSISNRGRRGSADKRVDTVSPTRQQQNITIKGIAEKTRERVEQGNGGSRRDRVRMGLAAGVTAKSPGEVGS